jgi:3-oxoadipate enol-lactonase
MAFIAANGLTVNYDLRGPIGAPVVMFANSLGTSLAAWDPQVAALAQRYRILRYDMRGHGLTDCPQGPYAIDQLAEDAAALLEALQFERVHLCGLSVGGMVAQRLAVRAPKRIASLTLCDTASVIGPPKIWDDRVIAIRAGGMTSIVDGVLARWFTEGFRKANPVTVRGYANMLTRTPVEGYAGCCLAIRDADLRGDAAQIECPALVIVGEEDLATPPSAARELAGAIKGAHFTLIEGAAHIPIAERPDAITGLLNEFLTATR